MLPLCEDEQVSILSDNAWTNATVLNNANCLNMLYTVCSSAHQHYRKRKLDEVKAEGKRWKLYGWGFSIFLYQMSHFQTLKVREAN